MGPASDQAVRVSRDALRVQHGELERLFERELASLVPGDRQETLEAMFAATSPLTWENLRRSRGLSLPRARAVVKRTLVALLRDVGVALD